MKYRKWWYGISIVLLIPGLISMFAWGLRPSIDFTGGSKFDFIGTKDIEKVRSLAQENGLESISVYRLGGDSVSLRFKDVDEAKRKEIVSKFDESFGDDVKDIIYENVGPSVSADTTRNSFLAIGLASLVIIIYIAFSFRRVPSPAKSWEFGVAAVLATIHDTVFLVGTFSLLGYFYGVEIDPLIVTAILTIIGFSVHDTIVIFDRIRENLIKINDKDFETIVNISVLEMLPRTINTSFLGWVPLVALFVFGGETIRWFVFALMIGMVSGTYSSILNASPLLVTWQNYKTNRKKK
jgi:preprotein translocase subunit SecF